MNFEQLLIKKNKNLPHKIYSNNFLRRYYNYLKYKEYHAKKLKLGSITFEINQISINNIIINETLDIKYTQQDNTQFDNLKLENRLKNLKWKNDIYNILALILIIVITLNFFYFQINLWYENNLNFSNIKTNNLINKHICNNFFIIFNDSPSLIKNNNIQLNNILFKFCEHYNFF